MLQHLWTDLRYAARRLAASPGFALAAILTIGLGVGVNTGIFSVLNGVALRELPAPDADRLVNVHQLVAGDESRLSEGSSSGFSTSEYRTYRDGARTLTGLLAYSAQQWPVALGDETARRVGAAFVSCNYFDVLQSRPALGTGFGAQHCEPGAPATIVLGHDLWTSEFGADPGIIGRDVVVNRISFTVVGVAAEGRRGLGMTPVSVFLPTAAQPTLSRNLDLHGDERMAWLALIGRRAEGASIDQVRAELAVIAAGVDRQRPPRETTLVVNRARPFSEPGLRPIVFAASGVVMAAFGLVLLIACANVGNLMLARAAARSREIAVRLSLGASRARIAQQLLTESLLISAAGGLLGSALAMGSAQALIVWTLSTLPLPELSIDASPDVRVFAFALVLSLATGVVCGLAPALRASRRELHNGTKRDASEGSRPWGGRLRGTLVGVQVAVCMVLMIAAGLLLRGLHAAQTVEPGFAYEDVAVATINFTEAYSSAERRAGFHRQLMARVGSQPGIDGVAQAAVIPLSASFRGSNVRLPGQDEPVFARVNSVSSGYFSLLGIPIVRGRTFTESELAEATAVIVTETTARRLWPGQDPIGQTIIAPQRDMATGEVLADRVLEVVGVARDAQVTGIGQIPSTFLYLPAIVEDEPVLYLLARSRSDPALTAAAVRAAAAELDPAVSVSIEPLEASFDLWRDLSRLVSGLSTSLGMLALVLAAVGVYGVVAYAAGQRLREIGIRIALGASRHSVLTLMLKRTMRPVVVGAVIGIAAAAGASRVLSSVLFGVSPADPAALAGAALVVTGVALAAGILPARRAARVDPMTTLHYE